MQPHIHALEAHSLQHTAQVANFRTKFVYVRLQVSALEPVLRTQSLLLSVELDCFLQLRNFILALVNLVASSFSARNGDDHA